MRNLCKRLLCLLLAFVLVGGTAMILSGCKEKTPAEKAAEAAEEAKEKAGEATEGLQKALD